MERYNLKDRILGCLYCAGMGDAMGGPSETFSQQEIRDVFGGWITGFLPPGDNVLVKGNEIGEVTDDTSQMYEMGMAIVKSNGFLTVQGAADALVGWSQKYPKYYPRNAGATTRFVIEELLRGDDPETVGRRGGSYRRGTSNGCAMRVASAGLIHPGNLQGAIKDAIIMTKPSHGTQHAYSGACSIACGISEALKSDSDVYSVIKASLYGAKKGYEMGLEEARIAAGEDLYLKILYAVEISLSTNSMEETLRALEAKVGNDGQIQNSVASAIGIFAATEGNPEKTIIYGANYGGDTDTISCIAGTLSGAFSGLEALRKDWIEIFVKANPTLNMDFLGDELYKIATREINRR